MERYTEGNSVRHSQFSLLGFMPSIYVCHVFVVTQEFITSLLKLFNAIRNNAQIMPSRG
jgi:hypothetical protein